MECCRWLFPCCFTPTHETIKVSVIALGSNVQPIDVQSLPEPQIRALTDSRHGDRKRRFQTNEVYVIKSDPHQIDLNIPDKE